MGYEITPNTPRRSNLKSPADVSKGGTGGNTPESAATNLGGIHISKLGIANGIAQADSSGKLKTTNLPSLVQSGIALMGLVSVYANQSTTYKINNYDSLTTYTVSADRGTVYAFGDTLYYTAPSSIGSGTDTITLNGQTFNLTIGTPLPNTPTIAGTTTGTASNASLVINGSDFAMQDGSAATHTNSDWEVYSDAGMTTLVKSSYADTTNKTGWAATALNLNTTYYVRARYRTGSSVSAWSNTLSLTTLSKYELTAEEVRIAASGYSKGYFGTSTSLSGDGTRIAIGAPHEFIETDWDGALYIYVRSGSSWTLERRLVHPYALTEGNFGYSVALDYTGSRLIVGSPDDNYGGQRFGVVYAYSRTGTTWTQEFNSDGQPGREANQYRGVSVSVDSSATRMAVGCPRTGLVQFSQQRGSVEVFIRNGTSWSQEVILRSPDEANEVWFGESVDISADGNYLVVGCTNKSPSTKTGRAYVYVRNGSTWTLQGTLIGSNVSAGQGFAGSVSINGDGSEVIVGFSANSVSAAGVYSFTRNGTSWSQKQIIESSNFLKGRISADGTCVVTGVSVTSPYREQLKVYQKDSNGNWMASNTFTTQGAVGGLYGGKEISLTTDGSRMSAGMPFVSTTPQADGAVNIYF